LNLMESPLGDPAQPQALLYTAWKRNGMAGLAEAGSRGLDDRLVEIGTGWNGDVTRFRGNYHAAPSVLFFDSIQDARLRRDSKENYPWTDSLVWRQ
jgi:hypothetical protein